MTSWIHVVEVTVISVHSDDVSVDELFPWEVGFWKVIVYWRREVKSIFFFICLNPLELVMFQAKGTKYSPKPLPVYGQQPYYSLTPPNGPPDVSIYFCSPSNHAKGSTKHKFYQGAANRGLINAVFWGSAGGFLITNAVRLLHWCPGWKIKIWQRVQNGTFKNQQEKKGGRSRCCIPLGQLHSLVTLSCTSLYWAPCPLPGWNLTLFHMLNIETDKNIWCPCCWTT